VVGSASQRAAAMTDSAKTSAPAPAPAGARGQNGQTGQPGQPGQPDIDEFAHIPSPRTRHPLLALAAAALALYLVIHVRHDLRYTLSPAEPLELGDAHVTFSPRTTVSGLDNRYVRVRATPDRASGLEVDTKGSWTFSQFFRVLGTGDRLVVHRLPSPLPAASAEDDVIEGRLVRFGELPFEDAVRAYFAAHVTATHFFAVDDLRAALLKARGREGAGEAGLALHDRAGDPVTLAPDEPLVVDVARPDEVRVGLPRERFPDCVSGAGSPEPCTDGAAARAEIERRGGVIVADKGLIKVDAPNAPAPGALVLGTGPPPTERWTFIARFPADKREAALSALGEIDRKVEIRDARESVRVRVSELAVVDEGLSLRPGGGSERRLSPAAIAAVRTVATVHVPDDAYLLVEGDRPRDHWPTLFLALAVAVFGVVNLSTLAREMRK
jgi:hypothetical protein